MVNIISKQMHDYLALFFYGVQAWAETAKTHAVTVLGEPKYQKGFKHFDYVNATAPKGGVLSTNDFQAFDSFNPFIARGNAPWHLTIIYDRLLTYSADELGTAYGLVADSIELPEDNSWVAFTLHPEARFHDGQPITAEDVVFSFTVLRDKGEPRYKQKYRQVASVKATSPQRVMFTFDQPGLRKLPVLLGQLSILPKHFWTHPDHDFDKATLDVPLGSGPYKIASFIPGHRVIYERVKNYWAEKHPTKIGRHNFDRLIYEYYKDDHVAFEAFKKGDYNFREEMSSKDWALSYDFPSLKQGDVIKKRIPTKESWGMNCFAFNTRRPYLKNPTVRRALTLAYDFDAVNKNTMYSEYERVNSYFGLFRRLADHF